MSSNESDSSPPSSPRSPPSSPAKKMKYGRSYRKVALAERIATDSEESSDGNDHQDLSSHVEDDAASLPTFSEQQDSLAVDSYTSDEEDSESSSDEGSSELTDVSTSETGSDVDACSNSSDSTDGNSDRSSESDVNQDKQMLFDGSPKTLDEAVLKLMDLYIKKRWRKSTLHEVLSFNTEFFPSNLPRSVYKLFKYVEDLTPDSYNEIKHFYCSDCLCVKLSVDVQCVKCQSEHTSVFFELPVAVQIQYMFEYRGLAGLVDSYRESRSGNSPLITDVCSGSGYREVKDHLTGQYDLTLVFNTDGVSPVKSSSAHLYPILATISEIPPSLRSSFMLVCGLWYDVKSAPIMNDYFCPFKDELVRLYDEGLMWTHPTTKAQVTSKIAAPLFSGDALGRADVLQIQHHNGKRGCGTCEQKSVRIKPTAEEVAKSAKAKKLRRYVYQENPARLRDRERMERQGRKAKRLNKPVKGVVGLATVSQIPLFDRSSSAPPEYMHLVCLGVVKLLLSLWLTIPGAWNIKDKVGDIDKFILGDVKVTDEFNRVPKRLKDYTKWKASELRAWLLYVSLPALCEILPDVYFQHYMLLISAVYSLLKDKLAESEITKAEIMLRMFVRDFSSLYGHRFYVYNVHNLLHLCHYVRKWGPMWAYSAFPFESFNHILSVLSHGTKHKGQEIVNRLKLAHGVEILRSKVAHVASTSSSNEVLGCPVDVDLNPFGVNGLAYQRARHNGVVLTAECYDVNKIRGNSFVHYIADNVTGYGRVLYFYVRNSVVHAVVRKFKVEHVRMLSF